MQPLEISYQIDASNIKGNPSKVYTPNNIDELKNIVNKEPKIVIRGGGTSLVGGTVAFGEAIVDISRLNKIENIDLKREKVIVQAGVILKQLNDQLKNDGYFFPVIPSSENSCTIGGMIATNAAGLRAIKYGSTSDWVESIDVLFSNGEMQTFSGKEIEYFAGLEGITGMILSATLKIVKLPKFRTASLFNLDTIDEVIKKVTELKSNKNISVLEYLSKNVANGCNFGNYHVLIAEFEESNQGEIKEEDKINELLTKREAIGPVLTKGNLLIYADPLIPHDKIGSFILWCKSNKIPLFGHIGIGVLHPRFHFNQQNLIQKMYDEVLKLGGKVSGEHGIGITKKKFLNEKEKSYFTELKDSFDKNRKFNPNHIIGNEVPIDFYIPENANPCINCGICKGYCPVFKLDLTEISSPRGLAYLESNGIKANEFFQYCTGCGLCGNICPVGYKLKIDEFRNELVKNGKESKANKEMIENIRKHGNPFGDLKGEKPKNLYCC